MRKLRVMLIIFLITAAFKHAYCQDNVLAIDTIKPKEITVEKQDNLEPKQEAVDKNARLSAQETPADDDSQDYLKKIKAYREFIDNKQRELEFIRLDLEKNNLLLKKKEAQKQIYEIEKTLPEGKKEESMENVSLHRTNRPALDISGMKILLLVISGGLKEAVISLKSGAYSFQQGDEIEQGLFLENIDSNSVTLKKPDGLLFKLNFIN